MTSVKVAVRVRPFNQREIDMGSSNCILMEGPNTTIINPETQEPKPFAFDFSYWSHDGFRIEPNGLAVPTDKRYADQQKVFDDLGQDVLKSAFDGYNSSLFAYGQTGSGKSYSMVGYNVNKGIIPMVCEEMFKAVEKSQTQSKAEGVMKRYQVTVTMLEIYNECIRDLLNPAVNPPGGLKVRSQPGIGVYVEKLTPVAVANYSEIEARMEEGTANRTVASTKMNATSSRAHTVFGINFTTITEEGGIANEITSRMNLVDLAGSERADSTGATGDRLKEGCAINASLSALGNVISALADISSGKKKVFVPYRNSALTRLLQDALGGNSRTIMICALSPADVNYDETLSTLRYADRAKKIKNKVTKMENPTDKIIRMLKEENARLMALLSSKGISVPDKDVDEHADQSSGNVDVDALKQKLIEENEAKLKEQMEENERMIREMQKSWAEKLADAHKIRTNIDESGAIAASRAAQSNLPYFINLHEDPQMSECVVYIFKHGRTRIGRRDNDYKPDIVLSGLSISKEHADVNNENGHVVITAINKSKTFVNGELVIGDKQLKTGDRVILGNNFVFRFINPEESAVGDNALKMQRNETAWADAIDEFSTKQGLRVQQSVSGEMGNLEREEAKKRKELEEKLAKLEEDMHKEREMARSMLEQQKKLFAGRTLSDEEKAQLAAIETQLTRKTQNLEDEISKRREISEKMLQEQMKRKRHTKKVEEKLAKLIPLINEANQMAEELQKPVRFEARLVVKSTNVNMSAVDELRNLKTIDIQIRVTSTESGNIWNWNTTKFDSRLYMMRELYQDFVDFGPRDIVKSKDPFWDPPEAIEIGKAYIYLKALSQLVEIENDFSIVDYKGDEQGLLTVEIFPEGPNGEELDYLSTSEELIGQSVDFIVRIPGAKKLPAKYSNDVYVVFNFGEDEKETAASPGKTMDPVWKFEHRFKVTDIQEDFRQYLLKDAAIFEVRGFSDKQISAPEMKEAKAQPAYVAPSRLCVQCEENLAVLECLDCQKVFCVPCQALLHKSVKKRTHTTVPLDEDGNPIIGGNEETSNSSIQDCNQCEETPATVMCIDCSKALCPGCEALLHKSAKKKVHNRVPIHDITSNALASQAVKPKCDQCDEQLASISCADCGKKLCGNCEALLHKSVKRLVMCEHRYNDRSKILCPASFLWNKIGDYRSEQGLLPEAQRHYE